MDDWATKGEHHVNLAAATELMNSWGSQRLSTVLLLSMFSIFSPSPNPTPLRRSKRAGRKGMYGSDQDQYFDFGVALSVSPNVHFFLPSTLPHCPLGYTVTSI